MQTRKNLGKPIHINTFKTMASKPKTPKKGVVYYVEPIKSMTNDPTIKGDVFKKFVDGKLIKQVFVSKNRMKKIIGNAKKTKFGGLTQNKKYKQRFIKKRTIKQQPLLKRTVKNQPVYVKQQPPPPPVYVNQQPPPQGQLPAQQIYAADNTTMGQAAKQGLAGGVGFFAAEALVSGVVNAFTGDD
jgi:hypothetical protein